MGGKVAVVTGASRGIGFAISKKFIENGMKVYMVSRNRERLEDAARRIRGSSDEGYPVAIPADVSNEENVKRVFSYVMERENVLDVLVNNAGVIVVKPFLETSLEDLRKVFSVNVEGTFLCSKEAFRIMREQRSGCIVNIASAAGLRGYPNQSVYVASKHAILGLTKVLAQEGKEYNIRVIAVSPAGVRTDMMKAIQPYRPDLKPENLIEPEDVAEVVVFVVALPEKAEIDNVVIRRRAAQPYFL